MKITIIGAGIGGLTLAIALKQKGFEIEIFEASAEFKKVGSGINLAINAMRVFKDLDLYDLLINAASHTKSMSICDEQLNPLSVIDLASFEAEYQTKSIAIHRATLHQILLDQLADVPIHLNKKVKTANKEADTYSLEFEDGSKHQTKVLIGADGIHSAIRNLFFEPVKLRVAKQVCWRGITDIELDPKYQNTLLEPWGKGKRFGFVAIGKNKFYWYALANYKTDFKKEYEAVDLSTLYSDFHPIVRKLISATPKENIILNEIIDFKPITCWHNDRVALLGDAAHATTPNLGQGACQAIESAYVLANCMAQNQNIASAFGEYQNSRIEKATYVANTSWNIGKMAHLENALLIKLRNFMLRITPQKIGTKQTGKILK